MNERDQIITFLLNQCDAKAHVISDLQEKLKAAEAQIAKQSKPKAQTAA